MLVIPLLLTLHTAEVNVYLQCFILSVPFSDSPFSGLVSMNSRKEPLCALSHLVAPCDWLTALKKPMWAGVTSKSFVSVLMAGWFHPRMALGSACWGLMHTAANLLTACPKKLVPWKKSVPSILTMMWYWQQSSLQLTVRLPRGALVDVFLCISQSSRRIVHQQDLQMFVVSITSVQLKCVRNPINPEKIIVTMVSEHNNDMSSQSSTVYILIPYLQVKLHALSF